MTLKKLSLITSATMVLPFSNALCQESTPHPSTNEIATSSSVKNIELKKGSRIMLIGGGLGSRMNIFNEFETELQRRYPQHDLYIRNLCKEGDTPAFRPHPSRNSHWVIPGGKKLVKPEYQSGKGRGHYPTPDQWLKNHKIDIVIGFFGYSESFDGMDRIEGYKKELTAFINHTKKQKYNRATAPQLAIVSPAAFENLSAQKDLPTGEQTNKQLSAYTAAMAAVCAKENVLFVDAFSSTQGLYSENKEALTSNGHNLNSLGYKKFATILSDSLFGNQKATGEYATIHAAVSDKNRYWLNDYKMPNGVHTAGRRYKPFGNVNYPDEYTKIRQYTEIRDKAIWALNKGEKIDIATADANTIKLKPVPTNYAPSGKNGVLEFLSGEEVEKTLELPEGYEMKLFACEKSFPDLQNPSQMAFDNQGRLWVGCMSSYPHYRIGDPDPNDKILILEDTNNDGVADKQTTFVDGIHIPMGFEIMPDGGAILSLGNDLVRLYDTDGDSKADKKEFLLSGFDDHDTHHAISSFCADPSGAIYMGEGVFSHSNVETPYGPVRATNGGFYRYNPQKGHLERTAQYSIPNPWGIAFDEWGQNFFLFTSGTSFSWMQQTAVKPRYDVNIKIPDLLTSNKVRPTSGVEFISSRHFPDEVQGDVLICNNIKYLGAKQHQIMEDKEKGGYTTKYRQDLFKTEHGNFRPVDLEFAPDGSLYVIDWHNPLIGHMQHSARDPHRDHVHGRVYRITYPSRQLVKPAKIHGASLETLLDNLKLPEIRTRYRTRRELRGRNADEVLAATQKWVKALDKNDPKYNHHLTEAVWVTWGINKIDSNIIELTLNATDHRARAAAVRASRYNIDKLPKAIEYILTGAKDAHSLVRHEAVVAASWLPTGSANKIIEEAKKKPIPANMNDAVKYGQAHANNSTYNPPKTKSEIPSHLPKKLHKAYLNGKKLYEHGEACGSCHKNDGKGLPDSGVPPLDGSEWVKGDKKLLSKIALHGVFGKMKVKGKEYNSAMPGFAHRVPNKDIADMLTYIRNAWSNKSKDGFSKKELDDLLKATEGTQMFNTKDLIEQYKIKGQ